MAQDIGKLALSMSASPSGFVADLNKSERALKNFASVAAGIGNAFKAPFTSLSGLAGGLKNLLVEASTRVFDEIDEISKLSDVLDLSTEALVGFQHAGQLSGVSTEDLNKGLEYLTRNLGKAQIITEAAGASLEKFGINTDELAAMDMEARVLALADSYVKLAPGIDRSTFATAAFGKAGIRLSKFLEEGSEGLKKFSDEAKLLGLTFTRQQGSEVEKAGDAMARISLAAEGFKRQLAIGIAPLVSEITEKFMKWLPSVGGVSGVFRSIANTVLDVASAMINVAEAIANIVAELKKFNPKDLLVKFVPSVREGAARILSPGPLGVDFGGARELLERMRSNINDLGQGGDRKRGVEAGAARAKALAEDIGKLEDKLAQQISTFGQAGTAAEVYALRLRRASDAELAGVFAKQKTLDDMKAREDLFKRAEGVIEGLKSPADVLTDRLDDMRAMVKAGALTWEQWEAGAKKAALATMGVAEAGRELALPAALQAGTASAVSAVNRFMSDRQQGQNNPNAKVEALLEQHRGLLRQILDEERKANRANKVDIP